MDNLNLALTLLLAGFIIVFLVLVLLIIIISLYGMIIQAVAKSSENRKNGKPKKSVKHEPESTIVKSSDITVSDQDDTDEIPGEIIAVIAAAVDAVYGSKPHRIRSVKRSATGVRSAWGNAGAAESTQPFVRNVR